MQNQRTNSSSDPDVQIGTAALPIPLWLPSQKDINVNLWIIVRFISDSITCFDCNISILLSSLTQTVNPYKLHLEENPHCPFICGKYMYFVAVAADIFILGKTLSKLKPASENPL